MPGADRGRLVRASRSWLGGVMHDDTYIAWLVDAVVEDAAPQRPVAGAGAIIMPWPPGPFYSSGRLAFVYNVYTEPEHRRHGLARRVMDVLHAYCREAGIGSVALNASISGRTLYESMGYRVTSSPMMFLSLE